MYENFLYAEVLHARCRVPPHYDDIESRLTVKKHIEE